MSIATALYNLEFAWTKIHEQPRVFNSFILGLLFFSIFMLVYVSILLMADDDGLPIVNRRFFFEPRVFARFRWAVNARSILKEANDKVTMDFRLYGHGVEQQLTQPSLRVVHIV